jgi:hypothetical protein
MPTTGGAVTGGAKRKHKHKKAGGSAVTGGAKRKKHRTKTATGHKKKKKRTHRKTGGASRDLDSYKKEARRLGIPLSTHGHVRNKAELSRAISYRKHH